MSWVKYLHNRINLNCVASFYLNGNSIVFDFATPDGDGVTATSFVFPEYESAILAMDKIEGGLETGKRFIDLNKADVTKTFISTKPLKEALGMEGKEDE